LANSASARKRANQAEQRRKNNASRRSMMRTHAEEAYKKVVPILDSAATHGLISHNKAARHKSRLNTQIKAL
jgi:small subunit ribosomal protein S20